MASIDLVGVMALLHYHLPNHAQISLMANSNLGPNDDGNSGKLAPALLNKKPLHPVHVVTGAFMYFL